MQKQTLELSKQDEILEQINIELQTTKNIALLMGCY